MVDRPSPLESCLDLTAGRAVPLTADFGQFYGSLRFPRLAGRSYVLGNVVSTLDGAVVLGGGVKGGGGAISGSLVADRVVMGLLRAVADVVVVGAGTLRAVPRHHWRAESIYPPLADEFAALRRLLGKGPSPLNVVVTGSGNLDLASPVFRSGLVPSLLLAAPEAAKRLALKPGGGIQFRVLGIEQRISASEILAALDATIPEALVLVEAGPRLMGDFFAEDELDDLFLTLAPQVAGRQAAIERPGFVLGQEYAPGCPIWGRLVSAKRSASHLFLRYQFGNPKRVRGDQTAAGGNE